MTIRVSIAGASGYAGGELLRLLLDHPKVQVHQATSESSAGRFVHSLHPNLRGRTPLKFIHMAELEEADLLFLALPHGQAAAELDRFTALSRRMVDLSADFRLDDPETYRLWYGKPHERPEDLRTFTYGLPEVNREAIRQASRVSGVGCNATATNLALLPLVRAELLDPQRPVIVDLKVGSSEGGRTAGPASHHPERSGAVRSFSPTGHRHTAEVQQALGLTDLHLSVTSVEMVRGVLATAHTWLRGPLTEKDLWQAYRGVTADEPFLRLVKDRTGIHRYPDPKILAGSNYADIGFELDPRTGRVVSLCALDNLVKGAAGSAIQCMNLMLGFDETAGLSFTGLHPA